MHPRVRSALLGCSGFVLLGLLWEGYKGIDGQVFGLHMPARADDASMPHLWTVARRFAEPEVRDRPGTVAGAVLSGSWYTFRVALVGFAIGAIIGLILAVLMQRFRLAERAWLPYVVLSQTIPLVALAPLIASWGGTLKLFGHPWKPWMSVASMAGYLAFFPVAVGALRGLQSPKAHDEELMRSYAASWGQTLWKLRLPASVPHLIPALKLAAASSIVGAIVAEISIGAKGGVGRLILDYFQKATGDPAQVYTAFIGAALLGMIVVGSIGLAERVVLRRRGPARGTA